MKNCGSCTACCTVVAIPELDKPAGVPCQHLTNQGCGIYEDRPQLCKDYLCGYKQMGEVTPKLRPDRAGFMISIQKKKNKFQPDITPPPETVKNEDAQMVLFVTGKINRGALRLVRKLSKDLSIPIF